MFENILSGHELGYLIRLLLCLFASFVVGFERTSRGKAAGVSTHFFVIAGSMTFAFSSFLADPASPARIAAQIVTGVGFLGAGIILKREEGKIVNLTTAASIWFAAALGMTIGFGWYVVSLLATLFAVLVPRLPHVPGKHSPQE